MSPSSTRRIADNKHESSAVEAAAHAAMSDEEAWSSLFLAKHDRAHREHQQHQHQHANTHDHQHQHNLLHRDYAEATASTVLSVLTEVTATISLIQQIDVDTSGNTFAIQTVLAESTQGAASESLTTLTSASDIATTSASASPASITSSSVVQTTSASISQYSASQSLNSTSLTTSLSSTLSASATSASTYPSMIVSSNSTTLISSSTSSSGSSSSIFSSSSLSYLSSSSSSSTDSSTFTSSSSFATVSTSSTTSSTSTRYSPTSSASGTGIGGAVGGTAASTGSSATSTAGVGSTTDNDVSSNGPSTPAVVGGVIGSVAGVAVIVFLILAFLRWKKRHSSTLQLGTGHHPSGGVTSRDASQPGNPSGGMTERASGFVPAAMATLTGFANSSRQKQRARSGTAESERGFVRVSGRKLPSVLQHGGDGYGTGLPEPNPNTLSGSSFYRDSQGFYGGTGAGTGGPLGVLAGTANRDSGPPVMRPSPARTPITQQNPFEDQPPRHLTPPPARTALGRSPPSQDGSQRSRFAEDV